MTRLIFDSILGNKWQQRHYNQRLATHIRQKYQLPEILSNLLSARNIDPEKIENFLDPKIKHSLPDPLTLGGVSDAVDFVIKAIKKGTKITIFGDYDVDGATSCAILKRFFASIGIEIGIYIPDRILEGYGPNSQALLNLKNSGTGLVITVDCGTVSFKPLEDANRAGLDVIVIDHHLGVTEKPKAIAIINPNLLDETFPHKNLCAAGVTFLFIVAVNQELRKIGFYADKKEPNLLNLLDLVALGTVCDVMSLTGLNRAFVSCGLKIMAKRQNLGITKICDLAAMDNKPNSYSLGFIVGPRINAGGRVGKSDLGARLLSSNDEIEVTRIAQELEILNQQRKEIEANVLAEAIKNLENGVGFYKNSDPVIFAIAKNWHQGVIGIAASRLKDLYNKPVAVIAIDDNGIKGKASCRSIAGIDFGAAILDARVRNLIIEGGGHAMAAGFSIACDQIKEFHQFLCERFSSKIEQLNFNRIQEFDIKTNLDFINFDLIQGLSRLEPFGVGNHKPKFLLTDAVKIKANLIGKNQEHVSCIFANKSSIGLNNQIQAVAFRCADNELGKTLLNSKSQSLNLVGHLDINSWMGIDRIQMIIEDLVF